MLIYIVNKLTMERDGTREVVQLILDHLRVGRLLDFE